jgi:hypothetical protein
MPVINPARNTKDIVKAFNDRRAEHSKNGADRTETRRKPRIFPLRDQNKHSDREAKISGYTACGILPGGRHISVPGFPTSYHARLYGALKGWTDRCAIASRGHTA